MVKTLCNPQIYIRKLKMSTNYNVIMQYFGKSSPVTGLEWTRGFQEVKVKVKQSCYRPGVGQRVPRS
jgi:hypothetical protein